MPPVSIQYLLTVGFVCTHLGVAHTDLFSGTAGLKRLSVAEESVVEELEATQRQLEEKIHRMKEIFQNFKSTGSIMQHAVEESANPIAMYQVVKRWHQMIYAFHLEQATVTTDPDCRDNDTRCPDLGAHGVCQQNPDYMLVYCRETCGVCVREPPQLPARECTDDNDQCSHWAKEGECETNPDYMLVYCQKSCHKCPGSASECRDISPSCEMWAKDNLCDKDPEYMRRACQKSCKLCTEKAKEMLISEILNKLQNMTGGKIPTAEDHVGAAYGLIRLQRTYNLSTGDLVSGIITGLVCSQPLTPQDMYRIGKAAIGREEWGYAIQWLQQAMAMSSDIQGLKKIKLQMAAAYVQMKETKRAEQILTGLVNETTLDVSNMCYDNENDCSKLANEGECQYNKVHMKLNCPFTCNFCSVPPGQCFDHDVRCKYWLEKDECTKSPDYMHLHCRHSCKLCPNEYESELLTVYLSLIRQLDRWGRNTESHPEPNTLRGEVLEMTELYEHLCAGHAVRQYDNAVCRYRQALLPYYVFKEEILCMNPRIAMVYDVINDRQAEDIKRLSKDKMARGLVGVDAVASTSRVSNVGWLADSGLVKTVTRRVEMITGLELSLTKVLNNITYESSDELQIVNYGIGGHYEPHTDYFELDTQESRKTVVGQKVENSGDRIATFLMYLSHVEAGGATVFPEMRVRVPPIKNAAAFWYNAKLSGVYDPLTLHAGCPVLMGEKWVANKWIREYGNTFKRRCGLTESTKYQ